MTSKWWAQNLFKGRIGEAIVEAILSEFGYKVERGGYEQVGAGNPRVAPDLVVTDPRNQRRRYVEVKYRSARPTAVQLDTNRIAAYTEHYPHTILAVSSSWDGAIYCAEVEDLPGESTLSLLGEYWKPIWHYFPLVKRGERLQQTWKDLMGTLSTYGSRQAFGRRDVKLWDGEYEALTRYLKENWDEGFLEVGIPKPETDKMTLEELWEVARRINAVVLVYELLDPPEENPVESPLMLQIVNRALDIRGEGILMIDIEKLSEDLGLDKDLLAQLVPMLMELWKVDFDEKHRRLAEQFLEKLEDGVGEAYLLDQATPFGDSETVDLKTAIRLAINPCRIDR